MFYIGLLIIIFPLQLNAQICDSSIIKKDTLSIEKGWKKSDMELKHLIIPAALISFGFIGLESDGLKNLNIATKNEIRENHPFFHSNIDNYSQFLPAAAVFGFQALGIKGKNNWKNEAVIFTMAMGISTTFVVPIKYITNIQRPDKSNSFSFPSGHTAHAFAAAEFLRSEYWDISPWIGVAGYAVAIGTGAFRLYNNKHWVTDVVSGAGFGIASTTLSYVIYNNFFKKKHLAFSIYPTYYNENIGLSINGFL